MTLHNPGIVAAHMHDYALKAAEIRGDLSRSQFEADEIRRFAAIHLVEILGEAAHRMPREIQAAHPEIPWAQIIGTRHRLIHGYDAIDDNILWQILSEEIPAALPKLAALRKALKGPKPG